MDYCGPIGLARSEFLTWRNDDQVAALAWMMDQRMRCPNGHYEDEWRDPADPTGRRPRLPPPYVADTRRCLACEAIEQERASIPPHASKGVYVVLEPFDPDAEAEREERARRNAEVRRGSDWGSAPD